jgi:uncharacterized protein YecE (DUF72 family)
MLHIGTSGFSYDDWLGKVYPAGMSARDQLPYYASLFSTVEINVTFYRIPAATTIEGWVKRTPPGFLFAVKAFQAITHDRTDPPCAAFVEALAPLQRENRLGCVLAQFPNSFRCTTENEAYLGRLREEMSSVPLVVELRHSEWVRESTFELLRSLQLGYCCVDEPHLKGLMPPLAVATNSIAYVRFHGRNAAKWYAHKEAWERYDYSYRDAELLEWVPRLRELEAHSSLTLAYFNNHYEGQAVQGARDLARLLTETEE